MSEKPANLAQALIAFQKSVPTITENAESFHGGFANLPGILSTIGPALRAAGLCVTQAPDNIDGAPALRTTLIHADSGEQLSSVTPLAINKGKNDTQEWGKAITYTRRFALNSVLNICVGIEDNDADLPEQKVKQKPAFELQQKVKPPDPQAPNVKRDDLEDELVQLIETVLPRGGAKDFLDKKAQAWNLKKGGSRVQQMTIDQLKTCINELKLREQP